MKFLLSFRLFKAFFSEKSKRGRIFKKNVSSYHRTIACRYEFRGTHNNRGVVPGVVGGRLVNLILTGGGQIMPTKNWHPRIFRPSYGPVIFLVELFEGVRRFSSHFDKSFDGTGLVSN